MKLNVIIPCYNESQSIPMMVQEITNELESIKNSGRIVSYEIILIDDGSEDNTWQIIESLSCISIRGLKLSKNVGHQKALWAGYNYSRNNCDMVVSIDADLQQDIKAISLMVDRYISGDEIVYGIRNNCYKKKFFKNVSSVIFYRIMNFFGIDILPNHADFRLLSNRVCNALLEYNESNIFIRGLVRLLGFKESVVYFEVKERYAGKSKYSVLKMLNLAIDGITSFSIKPLRIITLLGAFIAIATFCAAIYVLISYFFNKAIPGWSSILLSIWFLGGTQIFLLGIIGEYIGKTYIESKGRPKYHIERIV